jgi:hypothetical protein
MEPVQSTNDCYANLPTIVPTCVASCSDGCIVGVPCDDGCVVSYPGSTPPGACIVSQGICAPHLVCVSPVGCLVTVGILICGSEVVQGVDTDHDLVPDAAEPYVCFVEDQGRDVDGTCAGDDYTPPSLP